MFVVDRRGFLGLCAAALSSAGIPVQLPSSRSAASPLYIYASESFVHRRDAAFVLGFLITAAPDRHIRAIREIKKKMPYTRLMAYSSTDALRLKCARAMLQYFVEEPDLRFVARARVGDFISDASRSSQYPALFDAAKLPRNSVLRLKRRRPANKPYNRKRGNGDAEVAARQKDMQSSGLIKAGEVISRENNDGLVELSTLLTGALFGSESRAGDLKKLHKTKAQIVTYLREMLGVRNLNQSKPQKWEMR